MTAFDSASFSAGQDCGTRVAACVARLAALELLEDSHWWSRRKHRGMARALIACAAELESSADAGTARGEGMADGARPRRLVVVRDGP